MRLSLGHWLLAGLLAVAFHAAILIGWRAPVSSMTATPRGPKVEMATSLAGIMGQPVEMREIKAPQELDKAKPPEEMHEVEPDRPDTVTDQKPFEVAATAPVVIPREVQAAEPLPMVTPTEVTVLEAVPPTLKQVQPKDIKKTKPNELKSKPPPKEIRRKKPKELKSKPPPKEIRRKKPKELKSKPPPKEIRKTKPKELKSKPPPKEIKPKKRAKKKPVRNLRAQRATRLGTAKRGKGGRAKKVRRASSSSVRAYGRRVRGRILQRARGGGGSGTAVVSFEVSRSGGLRYARIARSSGKKYLDRRALAAVRGSYPKPPKGAASSQLRFTIAISFR